MPENKGDQQPIIIKKKVAHGGHHGGAWKVAYADFVTAMMAFFLVMWIVAQSDNVKQAVSAYFNDPVGFKKTLQAAALNGTGPSILKNGVLPTNRKQAEEEVRQKLMKAAEDIKRKLNEIPGFQSIKDNVELEMTTEGLKIELIESSDSLRANSTFFSLGGKELSPRGKEILTAITRELIKLNNKIVIEGHTDSKTYVNRTNYSNWELSTDRANSTRRLMQKVGLPSGRIEAVRGYADNRPRFANNPYDPRNRRITIIVLNDFSEQRYRELRATEWLAKTKAPK